MATARVLRLACKSTFRGLSTRSWLSKAPRPTRLYSSEATSKLQKCVSNELALEEKIIGELPEFASFRTTVADTQAVLQRTFNNEEIKVELDADSALESAAEDEYSERSSSDSDEDEDKAPFFLPMITITVTKPSGDALRFDCSFDESFSYADISTNPWNCLQINTMAVVPKEGDSAKPTYTADVFRNINDDFQAALMDYLEERGVDKDFSVKLLDFYKEFEHSCYVNNFLKRLNNFLKQ